MPNGCIDRLSKRVSFFPALTDAVHTEATSLRPEHALEATATPPESPAVRMRKSIDAGNTPRHMRTSVVRFSQDSSRVLMGSPVTPVAVSEQAPDSFATPQVREEEVSRRQEFAGNTPRHTRMSIVHFSQKSSTVLEAASSASSAPVATGEELPDRPTTPQGSNTVSGRMRESAGNTPKHRRGSIVQFARNEETRVLGEVRMQGIVM
jgi:hypothetical protein